MDICVKDKKFYIGGKRCKIISGTMHYFRVPRVHWRDRLLKLAEMGCNCVETYCAWNLHEPEEGRLDFSGMLDLDEYLSEAQRAGLYAVVRPGPYMCSEWDMGGLPWWLLKYDGIQLRSSDPLYLKKAEKYLSAVCEIVQKHLLSRGGNVIMLQIENEYGGYGNDRDYLVWLKDFYVAHGIDCLFVTSDSEYDFLTYNGRTPGAYGMLNCASGVEEKWALGAEIRGDVPPAVMEFWSGGSPFFGTEFSDDTEKSARELREALRFAEFLNIFKFHGGTSFGFLGGADRDYRKRHMHYYRPCYDRMSPLDQFGRRTKKYYLFREIIEKERGMALPNTASDVHIAPLGEISGAGCIPLSRCPEVLSHRRSVGLLPMEKYDQGYGYILYETQAFVGKDGVKLILPEVHDVAHIWLDGKYFATVRRDCERELTIDGGARIVRLNILVENLGRIKFGPGIHDPKGLVGDMYFYDLGYGIYSKLFGYDVYGLDMSRLPKIPGGGEKAQPKEHEPTFYAYRFFAGCPADAVLIMEGFTRGVVLVNGKNIGRYESGKYPEDSRLYLPEDIVQKGENTVLVFDVFPVRKKKRVIFADGV